MEFAPSSVKVEHHAESPSEKLEQFLAIYNKIMEMLGWLVERSQNYDPLIVSQQRQFLADLFASLGLDLNDPAAFELLQECYEDTMARSRNPQPVIDIPDVGYFEKRIATIPRGRSGPSEYRPGVVTPTLSEVAEYGWTDWSTTQSRNPAHVSTPEYIRDVASIMADPIAYKLVFEPNDRMEVTPTWEIANGRHRSLAGLCLGANVIREASMDSWVPIGQVPY